MIGTINKQKIFFTVFTLLNLIPIFGALIGAWHWHDTIYMYWSECALIGLIALISYAKYLIVFFLILGASVLTLHLTDGINTETLKITLTFWSLYSLFWLGYFEIGNSALGLRIRKEAPSKQIMFYVACMVSGIFLCTSVTILIHDLHNLTRYIDQETLIAFIALAVFVPTLTIAFLRIIHIVGAKHFLHFLFGTYHTPIESDKIVLFIDMIGSTKMAEKLSPKDSMRLISRFIFDASAIIRRHGGDIVNYTGDGLVVLWPINKANRAIEAIHNMRKRFNKTRPEYQLEFGVRPYVRMGLHAGPVVISQIGEEKLFLGLYGDTVNTAARLEQMNKSLETHVLISQQVVERLDPQWISKLDPLGPKAVPGRKEPIETYALRLRVDAKDPGDKKQAIQK